MRSVPVRLLVHRVESVSAAWEQTLRLTAAKGTRVTRPFAGDRIALGRTTLTVLGPLGNAENDNQSSLVVRWDAAGARFLLTGDADLEAELRLLPWGPELRADVLKAGHHGSRDATGASWLEAVRPGCGVISCGRDNLFGHPAPATLDRLRRAGAAVARTDLNGMVTVRVRQGRGRAEAFLARRD
jgi:competence protein ComEC